MTDHSVVPASPDAPLYAALTAPFPSLQHRAIGGDDVPYLTGEQVVTRLNEVFGPQGWSFVVIEHGLSAEADEFWCLGRLTVRWQGREVIRDQFGSNKVKRQRSSGTPLDIGFDTKGSATDALKKAASLIGIGLDLSAKTPTGGQPGKAPPAATGFDWTVFWSAIRARGLEAVHVTDRLGMSAGEYVTQHPGLTTAELLADPRLAP